MPTSSSLWTTRSFSSAVRDRPAPGIPSRRAASYSSTATELDLGGHAHGVHPVAVALGARVPCVLAGVLDRARDRARLARAHRVVVDLASRRQLGGGAGQEDLIGEVQLGPGDVTLDDLVAEVAGDLDRGPAVDAVEDRVRRLRRVDLVAAHEVDVLAGPLADVALVVEEDRLLVARLVRLDLREDRVEVLAAGLGRGDERRRADPLPPGDAPAEAVSLALLPHGRAPIGKAWCR